MFSLSDDRFELLEQVGEGGFGVVYEARDRRTDQRVAIKVMLEVGRVADGRFEREALLLADVRHPSVVRYIAHGRASSGHSYLAMEWLEGYTLEARLKLELLSVAEVLTLAQRVVAGLALAEQRGVVHRDIKPANLFLVGKDVAATKILDLGLARRMDDSQKLTRTGGIVGTAYYMSPEQARGERDVDPRSDVFSLGSVLYECLCNDLPFEGSHAIATLAKICLEEPVPIAVNARHVPARLAALVHQMLSKARHERPSYRSIAHELDEIAATGVSSKSSGERPRTHLAGWTATQELSPSERQLTKSEQRVLCAIFVRGVGAWSDVLDHELAKVAERLGARRERLLEGSQILLLEGHRSASDQAVISAQCALALSKLVERSTPIAICTGRARVAAEQPLLGELLERGMRLLWDTPPGMIRVDDPSAALLETRFELSGDSEQHVLERERTGGEAPRTLLGQPTRFIGRERELAQLSLIFSECVEEQVARPVLVIGPPGAGKSRLRYELVERIKQSGTPFCLLIARGDATRTRTQLGTLTAAVWSWAGMASDDSLATRRKKLRERVDALVPPTRAPELTFFLGEMIGVPYAIELTPQMQAARLEPPLMAERLLESFLEWLGALSANQPILLCVEDLHWSDPASVRFLDAALRSLSSRALMVLAFARPEVGEQYPELWPGRDLTELRLSKLTSRTCEKLLDTMLAGASGLNGDAELRSWLVERADGNPFFLEELVRGLKDKKGLQDLPDSVLGIVQARLDALGDDLKGVVGAASVFGQNFSVAAVRELLGGADRCPDLPRWLALLTDREVIFPRTGGTQEFSFRHALIRDAAYLLLETDHCQRAHRLAADWLEQQGASPAVLADHNERGGARERAAKNYCAAATAALEFGSLQDVIPCGERAVACGAHGALLGEVASAMAEAYSYTQQPSASARWSETARANLAAGSPSWWRATQVAALSSMRLARDEHLALIEEIFEWTPSAPTLPSQVTAIAYVAAECQRVLRADLADRLFALLPNEAPENAQSRAEACVSFARSTLNFASGDFSGTLRQTQGALRAFQAVGAGRDQCQAVGQMGFLLFLLGQNEESEKALRESIEIAMRVGSSYDTVYGHFYLAMLRLRRGQLDEAEAVLRTVVNQFEELQQFSLRSEAFCALAELFLLRADAQGAAEMLQNLTQVGELDPNSRATIASTVARLELLRGEPELALASARSAVELVQSCQLQECGAPVHIAYVDCLLANGLDSEAHAAKSAAKTWLTGLTDQIDSPELRHSFLTKVPSNARILAY